MKIFYDEKLEIRFCLNYLCLNELIGYVDLLDFDKTWPPSWLDIDAKKRVWGFYRIRNIFLMAPQCVTTETNKFVPGDEHRNFLYWPILK